MSQIKFAGAHRPPILGTQGAVASAHPLASFAGIDILKQGGNAFDAAVSVATTLNVVEPYMSGIGGIGILLAFDAKQNELKVLNYSGCTPMAATPEKFPIDNVEIGILSNLVPGSVSGWLQLHEKFGSMERKDLFSKAIRYARNGYPVHEVAAEAWNNNINKILNNEATKKIFSKNGKSYKFGEIHKNIQLANTIKSIAKKNIKDFYQGYIAKDIVDTLNECGGVQTIEDFENQDTIFSDSISSSFKENIIHQCPPNGPGITVLMMMAILEKFNFQDINPLSIERFHLQSEATKIAYEQREGNIGDPKFTNFDYKKLIDSDHINNLLL